ncbi:MAG: hypothetical protein H3C63_15620, partial [Candidatus Omnitrophica bacterium]|nr:hypothetical protein [Candidatus Omnitrophota bacterium]
MNREELEQRIVERLYGEIAPADDERLTAWLAAHPEDALVMEELQKT